MHFALGNRCSPSQIPWKYDISASGLKKETSHYQTLCEKYDFFNKIKIPLRQFHKESYKEAWHKILDDLVDRKKSMWRKKSRTFKFSAETFSWLGSSGYWSEINGSIDFFDLFTTLAVHRITNTDSISTSSGANRIYSARAVDSAHLFCFSFEWKNRKSTKQVEVFRKFQFRADWPP